MTSRNRRLGCFRPTGLPAFLLAFCFLAGPVGLGSLSAQDTAKVDRQPGKARALGSIRVIVPRRPCEREECIGIEISCPEVSSPEMAWLKVGTAPGVAIRGTVLATTGGPGTNLYEEESMRADQLIQEMQAAGFRTVQVQYQRGWLYSDPGQRDGTKRLGCRPATVAKWVHDNLHEGGSSAPYCAVGNSGGAAQVSYMLSHYGLESILTLVIPSGGPPMGRLDRSCIVDGPGDEAMKLGPQSVTEIIDRGFGFPPDGSGPCSQHDKSFRQEFQEASVAYGNDGDYFYPNTLVWFLFGEHDDTNATGMGMTYYDRLKEAKSSAVRMEVLPGVGHGIKDAPTGAERILKILTDECRVRE